MSKRSDRKQAAKEAEAQRIREDARRRSPDALNTTILEAGIPLGPKGEDLRPGHAHDREMASRRQAVSNDPSRANAAAARNAPVVHQRAPGRDKDMIQGGGFKSAAANNRPTSAAHEKATSATTKAKAASEKAEEASHKLFNAGTKLRATGQEGSPEEMAAAHRAAAAAHNSAVEAHGHAAEMHERAGDIAGRDQHNSDVDYHAQQARNHEAQAKEYEAKIQPGSRAGNAAVKAAGSEASAAAAAHMKQLQHKAAGEKHLAIADGFKKAAKALRAIPDSPDHSASRQASQFDAQAEHHLNRASEHAAAAGGAWDESKHPRDENGKFT